jgi:hypothetical protein
MRREHCLLLLPSLLRRYEKEANTDDVDVIARLQVCPRIHGFLLYRFLNTIHISNEKTQDQQNINGNAFAGIKLGP